MKKHVTLVLIILIISMGGAFLLPNFLKYNQTMEWPSISDFAIWTLSIFVVILILFHVNKPTEKLARLPDGYHELYNENNQITKKGMFEFGRQVSGTRRVYKKDGTFSHIEICTNGIYAKDISKG